MNNINLLNERIRKIPYNEDLLIEGICQYVKDNKMERFTKGINNEMLVGDVIQSFMKPVLESTPESLVDYFEYYRTYKELESVCNRILVMAKKSYYKQNVDENIDELERSLSALSVELYNAPTLKNTVDVMLSEGMLNVAYIRGESDKLSFGLSRLVNI